MKRVIILSGHNFEAPGCCNIIIDQRKPITEFDVATEVATRIMKHEKTMELDTIMKARNKYSDLVNEVNSLNGDILISIHFNAFDKKAQGTEVLCAVDSPTGRKYAKELNKKLVSKLQIADRGIKEVGVGGRGYSILNKTKPVALLVEPFFLDSVKTQYDLDRMINATTEGIIEFLTELK
jgi:N-acetylmuramoyl-L-alanine amidase